MANGQFNASGDGSARYPFFVEDVADLNAIRFIADKGYYFKQQADLDLQGLNWIPIENFNGNYDGNGFSINNLYIYYENSSNEVNVDTDNFFIGLFGSIYGSNSNSPVYLKNIVIVDAEIVVGSGTGTLLVGSGIGILAGHAEYIEASKCSVTGTIKLNNITSEATKIRTSIYTPWCISDSGYVPPVAGGTGTGAFSATSCGGMFGEVWFGSYLSECCAEVDIRGSVTLTDGFSVAGLVGGARSYVRYTNCYTFANIHVDVKISYTSYVFSDYVYHLSGIGGHHRYASLENLEYDLINCYSVSSLTYNFKTYRSYAGVENKLGAVFRVAPTLNNSGYPLLTNAYHEGTLSDYYYHFYNANGTFNRTGNPLYTTPGTSMYGKTRELMKKQSTFVDWDFNTVWQINEDKDYPRFRWQPIKYIVECIATTLPIPIQQMTVRRR